MGSVVGRQAVNSASQKIKRIIPRIAYSVAKHLGFGEVARRQMAKQAVNESQKHLFQLIREVGPAFSIQTTEGRNLLRQAVRHGAVKRLWKPIIEGATKI